MADYFDELIRVMTYLGENPKVKFIGQSVEFDGHALYKSMKNVPMESRLELPVFEDFQMGMSIGLALGGWIPVSIYPRMDFLIVAANQITNHLANIKKVSKGGYNPRVIIRTSVGAKEPLNPGPQHCQDHTEALKLLCRGEINVVQLLDKNQIFDEYKLALNREDGKSTILIEYGDLYHKG
ncbi:MAG: hypothetical protein M0R17_02135 [Candidatus Omnitrophica bacterium]|jgi:pyruvate/2-oxoglutarate/acetoin dehydrogenase E1 component|nr:hypothetical protein [Candidatus Omnitrophota bacterium]